MSRNHHTLVQSFVDMINNHDVSTMEEHTAPGHLDHNPAVADGIDANRAFWVQVFSAFPDLKAELHDVIAEGDRVAARLEYSATHQGTFLGIPASGRPVNFQSIDIWRVQDGLLAEHWDQLNMDDLFRQLGVDPAPAAQACTQASHPKKINVGTARIARIHSTTVIGNC
ncbi:ester cyclase, partial [Streptomyces sp. NPDC052687]|uniref:ester cyclase n=1 Tax=Streptomyces sp. NPDC052687 TaxID=3154759 RepID=UPI00341F18D2